MQHRPHIYGVMGEFGTPEELIHAVEKVREAGYRHFGGLRAVSRGRPFGSHGPEAQHGAGDYA